MCLVGKRYTAQEGAAAGIVDIIAEECNVEPRAIEFARSLANKPSYAY